MATGMGIKQYQASEKFYVAKHKITDNGCIITITNTGTPIDGIKIIIPSGINDKDSEILLGYETGRFLPTIHGTPSQIVLFIETPGIKSYENPIEVIVPLVTMEKDWIGVAGYKIDNEGYFEPLTTISFDKEDITSAFVTFVPLKMTWIYY
nr:hypothetical protein [uncultured Desulfobulbus sp.]